MKIRLRYKRELYKICCVTVATHFFAIVYDWGFCGVVRLRSLFYGLTRFFMNSVCESGLKDLYLRLKTRWQSVIAKPLKNLSWIMKWNLPLVRFCFVEPG